MKFILSVLIILLGSIYMTGCRKSDPSPLHTEINAMVIDESERPLDSIRVSVFGSTGCYFCGTRQDTLFADTYTGKDGKSHYSAYIHPKWQVFVKSIGLHYDLASYKNRVDGQILFGQANDVTMYMRKR